MTTFHLKKLAYGAIYYLPNILNLSISTGQIPKTWHKSIIIPILKPARTTTSVRTGAPVCSAQRPSSGKAPTAQNTFTHPFPPCSTWLSDETFDMHCTVDDHRRHCCRLIKKKAGSSNDACRARSDSCIRQCQPSTTALLCLQHQHALNNPSLALQLYAWQTSKVHFRKKESKNRKVKTIVVQGLVLSPALFNYYLADFQTQPPNIKLVKYADDITMYTSGPVVADLINGLDIYLLQVLDYINNKKLTVSTAKSTVARPTRQLAAQ